MLVKRAAPELTKMALRLFHLHVNAATNERFFSQTGLTHTPLRNRLSNATVTKIAQLRAELHRHRPKRKKAHVVVPPQGADAIASGRFTEGQTQPTTQEEFLDLPDLSSADEFNSEVNEWFKELELEVKNGGNDDDDYDDGGGGGDVNQRTGIQSAHLYEIFGRALEPLLDESCLSEF